MAKHKALADGARGIAGKEDVVSRNEQGYKSASKNRRIMAVRRYCRPRDVARLGPVDADLHITVTRVRPKVIQISGSWNLMGCLKDQFDDLNFDEKGEPKGPTITSGVVMAGPVDGARMTVRLQDAGYVMPTPSQFTFEVPEDLTIMQEDLNIRGGKQCDKGSLYILSTNIVGDPNTERAKIYNFRADQSAGLKGITVEQLDDSQ